jgi:hypothetical protein
MRNPHMSRIRCVEHIIQEGVANKGDPKVRVIGRRVVAQKISQLKAIHLERFIKTFWGYRSLPLTGYESCFKADTDDNSARVVDYLSPLRKNATAYGKTIWRKENF